MRVSVQGLAIEAIKRRTITKEYVEVEVFNILTLSHKISSIANNMKRKARVHLHDSDEILASYSASFEQL